MALIVLALAVEPARATFPGSNGKIVFVSDRNTPTFPNPGGDDEIYAMNPDGAGVQRLTDNAADDIDPTFSPDGSRLAFSSDRDDTGTNPNLKNFEVYAMDAAPEGATNQPVRLTTDPAGNQTIDVEPAWSPGGTRIAWRKGNHIHVMNADGSGQASLTAGSNLGLNLRPSWTPNGNGIVFVSQRDGNYELYSMVVEDTNGDGNGENQTRLTNNPGSDTAPTFSPDGTKIVFASFRGGGASDIYAKNTSPESATNQPVRLTAGSSGDSDPVFSPDGNRIGFVSSRNGNHEIYTMDSVDADGDGNGENLARLTNDAAPDTSPDWQTLLPPNDDFADAQTITGSTASVSGANIGATREAGEPGHLPQPFIANRTVWYTWTSPGTGQATVDICDTDFDNFLAVYTGGAINTLSQVTRDDGGCDGAASKLTFGAQAGTTYRIVAASTTFEWGNFVLNLDGPIPPDSDGDGVPDANDACPTQPAPGTPNGCPPPPPPPPSLPGPAINTAPLVIGMRPAPGSATRDRTPRISARVADRQTNLLKGNIRLYVDGRRIGRFAYNARTDRLFYTTRNLEPGRHTVKVVARDDGGRVAARTWRFRVVR